MTLYPAMLSAIQYVDNNRRGDVNIHTNNNELYFYSKDDETVFSVCYPAPLSTTVHSTGTVALLTGWFYLV